MGNDSVNIVRSIERVDNSIKIIDQTKLPVTFELKTLSNYKDIIQSINELEVRGAPAIGIAAAYGLAIAVLESSDFSFNYLTQVADAFKKTRPTAVNLAWAVDRVIKRFRDASPVDLQSALDCLWSEAETIHSEDKLMCDKIGELGSTLIEQDATILTYCNTGALATGGIGTALGVIYKSHQQGKNIKVYACETRPLLQGSRLTAWELEQTGVDVTLICDNMAGMLMSDGKIDCVVVGADRIVKNGDVANKIGTYMIAVLAEKHNIPFYVAAPSSTFDDSTNSGDEIEIEERKASEITNGFGKQTAPENIKVYSPAFDITPSELISAYITEEKIIPGNRHE